MPQSLGLWLIGAGVVLALLGVLVWSGGLSWFGRLPGDISIERDNLRLYFPLGSMILISIALSLLLSLLRRLL